MESLALAVIIITAPAMYGGPLALALTFWRANQISKIRLIFIIAFSVLSFISGSFLILENVSRGATFIGLLGLLTSVFAFYRVRKLKQ
jgi:hypothetical protein